MLPATSEGRLRTSPREPPWHESSRPGREPFYPGRCGGRAVVAGSGTSPPPWAGLLHQRCAIGGDHLPEMVADAVPIGEIDSVRQVAFAKGLGKPRHLVEGQRTTGIHRQIEIGITPRPTGCPRAEHPRSSPSGQIRGEDRQHQPPLVRRQIEASGAGHARRRRSSLLRYSASPRNSGIAATTALAASAS
jgi:hypothetical protein